MGDDGQWTEELWERARAGDPVVWDRLFRRYQLPLFVWVREMVRNEADALDIVQETFMRAIRHVGELRDPARVGAWLFRIARQRCWDCLRRRGREQGRTAVPAEEELEETVPMADSEPLPDQWLIRREDEARFFCALAALPEPQRAVVVLHFLEEFPLEEIAAILDVPVGTVKSRLYHARRRLRAECAEMLNQSGSTHENSA
jgi:RNA polymerase sigma-70 factor (ECF subfamily)